MENKHKGKLLIGFHSHLSFNVLNNNHGIASNHSKFINDLTNLISNSNNLKVTFHLSSNLITYLDKNFSDFSNKIRNLLDNNQLELFTGGIYEPLFPLISREDRQTQILLMSRLLSHTYGYEPCGMWLPDFLWEPHLALDLAKSRVQYTCLSKEYFLNAGLKEEDITGYYITEDEGRKIAIFPVSLYLNDLMEKYSPDECLKLMENEACKVLMYKEETLDKDKLSWLEAFLKGLSNSSRFETCLFNEYFHKNKSKGRIYLPSLQSKQILLSQQETNLLHKKMLRVSKKINSAKEGKSRFKVIKEMIAQAQELLLKGQNNDAYKDSLISGIYSPEERHNTYSNLIKAENLIDLASRQGSKWAQVLEIDYDCDGNDEIIIETETQNIYISPTLSGGILEHDFRPKNINITNAITRKHEPYHINQNGNLIYDNYLKVNLIEHFLETGSNLEKFKLNKLEHLTKEIISPYQAEKIKAKEETCKINLKIIRNLIKLDGCPQIELIKEISVRAGDSGVVINYLLTNKSTSIATFLFAVEFNLNPFPKSINETFIYLDGSIENKTNNPSLKAVEELKGLGQISIRNNNIGIDLSLSWNKSSNLFRCPIETLSFNFGKLENVFQGITILPHWQLSLEPDTPWELTIKQDIKGSDPE